MERTAMQALEMAQQMIAINSISDRSNAPVAALMRTWLVELGFEIEQLERVEANGERKVTLVAKRGAGYGGIAYLCHNDVVPVDDWNAAAGGPFDAVVHDGRLWGRGSCDMKGSAAAALAAIGRIDPAQQTSPIYFVATSDEEHGMHGAQLVAKESRLFREMVEHQTVGIIGEPTELRVVNAHKGTCLLTVTSRGRSAHSSTADGENANWRLVDFLVFLKTIQRRCESDATLQNPDFDPPTLSMNIVLSNRPAATNVTVGESRCQLFLRTMPNVPWQAVVAEIVATAESMGLEVAPVQQQPPVFTLESTRLVQMAVELAQSPGAAKVSYATDGCWFTELRELIVLGPGSIEQAHRPDEYLTLEQLNRGVDLYEKFFRTFAAPGGEIVGGVAGELLGGPASVNVPMPLTVTQTITISHLSETAMGAIESTSRNREIQFRRATMEDVAAVNALLRPFVNQRKLLRRTRAEMELLVPSGYLAEEAGRAVGFAAVEIYSRKLAEVQCLAVEPEYQGHGIGSELVRRCVELARERGVMEILAISSSDGFLQKLGFIYSLPDQKRALFCQLRSRDDMYAPLDHEDD